MATEEGTIINEGVETLDLGLILDVVAEANKGSVLDVRHPVTNAPLGIKITLAGSDSDIFRNFRRERANERLSEMSKGGDFKAADIEDVGIDLLTRCTLAWDWGHVVIDGETPAFNAASIKKVYKRFPWLKEQADTHIGSRANFIKG